MMGSYTIKDIAKIAGVGATTVSRVINNYSGVSDETRMRILEIIKQYNYIPNSNAKSLKQLNSQIVCIIVKGIVNPFFSRIVIELQKSVEAWGYIPFVSYIEEVEDEIRCADQLITEKKPVGIIFLGGSAVDRENEIKNLNSPCVFATSSARCCTLPGVSSVAIDDKQAAKRAVNYLLDLGHRNIVIMGGGIIQKDLIYDRYEGVQEAYGERGMTFDKENMFLESKFSYECAYEVMSKFLKNKKKFTAVFAMSDIMAIGIAKCVINNGFSVPKDISIIGFDGIDEARFYNPTIATIGQPYLDIARKSVTLLVKSIRDNNFSQHLMLQGKLIEGSSVKLISA
jgi:LacI family transcriptional regulator